MSPTPGQIANTSPPTARLVLGGTIFVAGFMAPLLIPLVAATDLPTGWKATISGLLVLGIPELGMLIAVAVLGKAGFDYLKRLVFRLLRRHAVPRTVGRVRYNVGLVLLLVPILVGWASPYVEGLIPSLIPGLAPNRLWVAITGDVILLLAFFVLGGDFWDKVRALFLHAARAHVPASSRTARGGVSR